jgi:hypothetical protein
MPQAARAEPEQDEQTHSGRLLLRMPQSLHAELAREAEREGVSLNALITGALSSAIGWRAPEGSARPAAPKLLRVAIVADLVLVAIAALVAIALLIAAWP